MGYLQSCVFVQHCPRIFLVQCQENLSNVVVAFAGIGYYQKIKITEKWPDVPQTISDWTYYWTYYGTTEK